MIVVTQFAASQDAVFLNAVKHGPRCVARLEIQHRIVVVDAWRQRRVGDDGLGRLELRAGNFDRARQSYRRALAIQKKAWEPGHYVNTWALYQLACVAAREGEAEQALDLLRRALDCGFDRDVIFDDADLAGLRGTPEFEEIVAEVRRRLETRSGAR